jgi:DNA-binding sugar fermentation-stimulating protein
MSFNNTERAELVIDSPEQLVVVFGKLLGVVAPNCSVDVSTLNRSRKLQFSRVCVYTYQVTVSVNESDRPSRWIAKFLRPSETFLL